LSLCQEKERREQQLKNGNISCFEHDLPSNSFAMFLGSRKALALLMEPLLTVTGLPDPV